MLSQPIIIEIDKAWGCTMLLKSFVSACDRDPTRENSTTLAWWANYEAEMDGSPSRRCQSFLSYIRPSFSLAPLYPMKISRSSEQACSATKNEYNHLILDCIAVIATWCFISLVTVFCWPCASNAVSHVSACGFAAGCIFTRLIEFCDPPQQVHRSGGSGLGRNFPSRSQTVTTEHRSKEGVVLST